MHLLWKKEDQWDAHLTCITLLGSGPFSRQISSNTLIPYTKLVIYLHDLELERLLVKFPTLSELRLSRTYFHSHRIVYWIQLHHLKPGHRICILWFPKSCFNLCQYPGLFLEHFGNPQTKLWLVIVSIRNRILINLNRIWFLYQTPWAPSVDWSVHNTLMLHLLVVITGFSMILTVVNASYPFWMYTLGSEQNETVSYSRPV